MSRVKNYEIPEPVRLLGEGAMGQVFYAVEAGLGREVALKRLRPEAANQPGVVDRFRREAQLQAQLNHPNIAQIWEFFQLGAEYYLAMEFIDGSNLARILRERGRLPYDEAVKYAIQALGGLAHAHKRGIVHRDIKPANLIRGKDDQVKVTDFGIARVRGASRETRLGTIIGTYEYISPEAAQAIETTALSDLYSLGVVLFELLTGRLPFENQSDYELLRMHIYAPRPSLRATLKDIPGPLDDIVQKAMDRKASRRFHSADEMAAALQECLDSGPRPTGLWRIFGFSDTGRGKAVQGPDITQRRRTDVSSTCHRVEDLIDQHLFQEAGTVLDAGFRSYPGEPEFVEMRNRLQRQKQQYDQAVAQQAELIGDLLKRGLFDEASRLAAHALSQYPRASSLVDLQHECQRRLELANAAAGEMAQVQGRVEEWIRAGKFQEATDYVLELQGSNQHHAELNKLLARILQARKLAEKQAALRKAVDAAIVEVRAVEKSQSLQAARDRLLQEINRLGQLSRDQRERLPLQDIDTPGPEAALKQELGRIDAAIEAARRAASIANAVAAAAVRHRERKWREAVEILDQVAAREGSDQQLDQLRASAAAELHAHEERVAQAAGPARRQIQDLQWEAAVLGLSTAIRDLPGEPELAALLQEAQRGLAQKRKNETIGRIKSEADRLVRAGDFAAAIQLLLDAVSQYPEDQTLGAALSQAIFERDAHLTREQVNAALQRASQLQCDRQFEPAIEVLREALRGLPRNPELRDALSSLESEWREIRRRNTVAETASIVDASLAAEDYQAALERLNRALADWPGDRELLELEQRTLAAQRQHNMREALRDVLEKGLALEATQHWDEAAHAYELALRDFPETAPELNPRLDLARKQAIEARRRARMDELDRNIRGWIQAGLLHEAEVELQRAQTEFPHEARFRACRDLLAAENQRIARESALRSATNEVRRLLERRSFEQAEGVLSNLEAQWGPETVAELRRSFVQARQEYSAAIESALSEIQSLVDRRAWDNAVSTASARAEQFPEDARFRALLQAARESREEEIRRKNIGQKIARIDELLSQGALDEAQILLQEARRDYPKEQAFDLQLGQLEEQRREQARETVFQRSIREVERLCRQGQWQAARQTLKPFLEDAKTRPAAEEVMADLSRLETRYLARTRGVEEQVRRLMEAKDYDAALSVLQPAAVEFPEITAFSLLLAELQEKSAAQAKARRVSAADRTIRGLISERQYEAALAEADKALDEYPEDATLRDLRKLIVAGMAERAAVAAVAAEVARLVTAGQGTEADRVLVDGLRRYPGRGELEGLRSGVDAARNAEWDRHSREAARWRAIVELGRLIEKGSLPEARAALDALEAAHGKGAAPEMEERILAAEREAQRQKLAAEEQTREAERQRLAAEQRKREAEQQRLVAEESERKREEQRRAEAMQEAYRPAAAKARRFGQQREWAKARQVLHPYLDNAATQEAAHALADWLAQEEAQCNARSAELDNKTRTLMETGQYAAALTLLEQAVRDFPDNTTFRRLLAEAQERVSLERKGQRSGTAEQSIRSLLAEERFEEALKEIASGIVDFPGEQAFLNLRAAAMAGIAEKAAVAGVAREVQRLAADRQWLEAEIILLEAQRRYPHRVEITELRAAVAAATRAKSRDLGLSWVLSGIEKLLGKADPSIADAPKKQSQPRRADPRTTRPNPRGNRQG